MLPFAQVHFKTTVRYSRAELAEVFKLTLMLEGVPLKNDSVDHLSIITIDFADLMIEPLTSE